MRPQLARVMMVEIADLSHARVKIRVSNMGNDHRNKNKQTTSQIAIGRVRHVEGGGVEEANVLA